MSFEVRILPERGFVHVHYAGRLRLDETLDALEVFAAHPEHPRICRHLVDLSEVTDFERNFPRLLAVQAQKAAVFSRCARETLIVYVAPDPVAQALAEMIRRSWEGTGDVLVRVVADTSQALSILDLPEDTLAAFDARTG